MGCGKSNRNVPPQKINSVTTASFVAKKNTKITDDYTIQEKIGSGSFGEVVIGLHKETQSKRAIKIIKKKLLKRNAEFEKMIQNEIRILKTLDHPNILKLYEHYEDEYHIFIVTEYVPGGELYDRLVEINHFSERNAAIILKQMLSALNYCHQNRIAHRDIKAENILIENNSDKHLFVKIADFGFAKLYDEKAKFSEFLGSPINVAPEILKEEPYDTKCDIWSCGIILYIILSGNVPFLARNRKALYQEIKSFNLQLTDLQGGSWNHISVEGKNFLLKMLQPDPKKRSSAHELLLEKWLEEKGDPTPVSSDISKNYLENLKNYKTTSKLQQAVHLFLSSQVALDSDTQDLRKIFLELDKSGDGTLTYDELRQGMDKLKGKLLVESEDIEGIIKRIDANNNGSIDYSEFIAATMNLKLLTTEKNLQIAFNAFDLQDHNGFISKEELKQLLETSNYNYEENLTKNMIQEVDQNDDDRISFQEFIVLVKKQSQPAKIK